MNPVVSIVMPFLNPGDFIREAIESVFAQTFPGWELLVVDDGSTDGSSEIAMGYAARYPERVIYLQHEEHQNLGASSARNLGLKQARGEYLAFLDSDDVFLPHKLKEQLSILEWNPDAGCMYGATENWYSWTGRTEDSARDYAVPLGLPLNQIYPPPELFYPFFVTQEITTPCTCSLLVRHSVVKRTGAFEESFRTVYTDQVFYVKLVLSTPIFVADGCWDRYRQHPDSSCQIMERTGKQLESRLIFLNWVAQYIQRSGTQPAGILQGILDATAHVKQELAKHQENRNDS